MRRKTDYLLLILMVAALICIGLCIFTDYNDRLFLPLGLGLCATGNLLNIYFLRNRK